MSSILSEKTRNLYWSASQPLPATLRKASSFSVLKKYIDDFDHEFEELPRAQRVAKEIPEDLITTIIDTAKLLETESKEKTEEQKEQTEQRQEQGQEQSNPKKRKRVTFTWQQRYKLWSAHHGHISSRCSCCDAPITVGDCRVFSRESSPSEKEIHHSNYELCCKKCFLKKSNFSRRVRKASYALIRAIWMSIEHTRTISVQCGSGRGCCELITFWTSTAPPDADDNRVLTCSACVRSLRGPNKRHRLEDVGLVKSASSSSAGSLADSPAGSLRSSGYSVCPSPRESTIVHPGSPLSYSGESE